MHAMYVKRNTFYSLFKNEKEEEKEEHFFIRKIFIFPDFHLFR